MKVFYCTDFEGHWPVGASAVVVAEDEAAARVELLRVLREQGLAQGGEITMVEVNTAAPAVLILQNGDY